MSTRVSTWLGPLEEGRVFVPVLFGARAVVASAVPVSMERMALRKEPVRLTA